MNSIIFKDLGNIEFGEAWKYQEELFDSLVDTKVKNRELSEVDKLDQKHYLLFCEHPPVYTMGKSGDEDNLLMNDESLEFNNITFFKINRGGDITYHGPGQLVGYPILDLDYFFTDIHLYLRNLEEVIILTLRDYGVEAGRIKGVTGVWLDPEDPKSARKICAMGVRCSRWVTMHGFAFNVNTDLGYFKNIIPCGIDDKGVTSLSAELGREIDVDEVKAKVKSHFAKVFEAEIHST